jgi:hypothetical protein
MKILRSIDFVYTLYEDDNGSLVFDLVIPAARDAWATYEKKVVLSTYDKILTKVFPKRADHLARKLIAKEKQRQQNIN